MEKMLDEFKEIVGEQHFASFLALLKEIGPDARTHRISVVIASILRYAVNKLPADYEDGSIAQALLTLDEEPYLAHEPSDEHEMVFDLVDGLCSEANLMNERESARGEGYSIAETVILEYAAWYNLPWEDS
jgi:hypothetical protein